MKRVIHGIVGRLPCGQNPLMQVLQEINVQVQQPLNEENLYQAEQVHGNDFCWIDKNSDKKFVPNIDALISRKNNMALIIRTADCVPIVIYDDQEQVIAAIHAGWRSTWKKITEKVVKAISYGGDVKVSQLNCFIYPAICGNCYQVSKDVADYFPDSSIQKNDQFFVDLKKENALQIKKLGVPENRIHLNECCTRCFDGYYSFRRNRCHERNYTYIVRG